MCLAPTGNVRAETIQPAQSAANKERTKNVSSEEIAHQSADGREESHPCHPGQEPNGNSGSASSPASSSSACATSGRASDSSSSGTSGRTSSSSSFVERELCCPLRANSIETAPTADAPFATKGLFRRALSCFPDHQKRRSTWSRANLQVKAARLRRLTKTFATPVIPSRNCPSFRSLTDPT